MDTNRGGGPNRRGASPTKQNQNPAADSSSPEQLLDAFRAAALSVTKLYKTSAAAETRARADGYQECLDDLLSFLDREDMGLGDGEGWKVRRWATERLDGGRDGVSQDSEDEAERPVEMVVSSPDLTRSGSAAQLSTSRSDNGINSGNVVVAAAAARMESAPPAMVVEEPQIIVPTQDAFTFQSSHPYPQLERLDLSDSRSHDGSAPTTHSPSSTPSSRQSKRHGNRNGNSSRSAAALNFGRGAGQKRKLNFAEIFDLGSLGSGKDPFGGGGNGKRSRHI